MPRRKIALKKLTVDDDDAKPAAAAAAGGAAASGAPLNKADSFSVGEKAFVAGDLRVDAEGLAIEGVEGEHDRGIRFEDLEEIKDLGSGCSSVVKLARHKESGEMFALKCIGLYLKPMRDQLLTELRALFKSDCEALVDFFGAMYREGYVAVVLEFMDLGGLDNIASKVERIPEPILAAMTYQMLWGLGYLAHERRVHRDIKPANVLVNTKGQVKLTDFGISRELSTAVLAKTFVGSFKYMSPERMASEPYSYSSDIWSLGLILFECATGSPPYPGSESHIDYVTTVLDAPPVALPEGEGFTAEFQDFVDQCLKKDPTERSSALTLLGSPWLELHGIFGLEDAVETTRVWLDDQGFKPPAIDGYK